MKTSVARLRLCLCRLAFVSSVCAAVAATGIAAEWQQPYPRLGSCTKDDTRIFSMDGTVVIPYADWSKIYHGDVGEVVESFLGKPAGGNYAQREPVGGLNACSGEDLRTTPASQKLGEIALKLEPWMDATASFDQSDVTPVLLEYLRVYECSLAERSTRLMVEIWKEETERRRGLPGGLSANPFPYQKLLEEWFKQHKEIQEELRISRPTLERALGIMGTAQMARMLSQNTNCVQRASLDIRNAVGLAADTASCLPRIWNAKDPMRDPPVCSDGRDNDRDGATDLADTGCASLSDMSE